eukprot:7437903-Alexandrium_andersonii.AAC.1
MPESQRNHASTCAHAQYTHRHMHADTHMRRHARTLVRMHAYVYARARMHVQNTQFRPPADRTPASCMCTCARVGRKRLRAHANPTARRCAEVGAQDDHIR